MAMMSELVLEIREMREEGYPALAIAATLDVPSELVWDVKDENESFFNGSVLDVGGPVFETIYAN